MKYLSFVVFLAIVIAQNHTDLGGVEAASSDGFVGRKGVQFILNGKPFYANGFNAYWLTYEATDPTARFKITYAFQNATSHGLAIARTWGFRDGAIYRGLQTAPGTYDEKSFQGLDFVIAEAKRLGLKMIITFVNNYSDFGGRKQYVDWAKTSGQNVSSDDDFYTNPLVKQYYKNHVMTMVNRLNTITKVAYKDEPTIMGWELINEPQCRADPSGKTLMAWIEEMAPYVKSVDSNHLLSTGLEGFYGDSSPQRKATLNPDAANVLGTDFIANHNIDAIDFASIHSYPDLWFPNLDEKSRLDFLRKWLEAHIEDAQNVLRKPLIIGEFGKPTNTPGYTQDQRDTVFKATYDTVYESAQKGGAATGAWFWHLISDGMDNFKDSLAIVLSDNSSTVNIISEDSRKLSLLFRKERLKSRNQKLKFK
ncbi:mannan endo-1,4-beta-mannosidase 3 isoform X1 [Capsella rubella]|uniref:mannan endo-1,4-beta-mannosidase 3 isoform X1 n=1 Tax=Capsella rubella TaxID=81985 RepID=UPI000CD57BE6|nr:mannan endo-1,4-beta-mannosidase 3 isoform X1 [Capsella rubella]